MFKGESPVREDPIDVHIENLREESRQLQLKAKKLANDVATVKDKKELACILEKQRHTLAKAKSRDKNAARLSFRRKNAGLAITSINLQGLYVSEAMFFLKKRILKLVNKNGVNLKIITGNGIQQEEGTKLNEAIIDYLTTKGITYEFDSENHNVINIDINGKFTSFFWRGIVKIYSSLGNA